MSGYFPNDYEADLRALLASSRAEGAGTHGACARRVEGGVIHYACGVMIEVGTPDAYAMHVARWRALTAPAPVSSGEAGAGEARKVEQVGDEWVATCAHGGEVWNVHRTTEYAARRSLTAHANDCPAPVVTPSAER